MKRKFTDEQIVKILNRFSKEEKASDLSREFGIATHTLYDWRRKFQNMTVNEARKLRELESENARLKKLVAEQALDIVMLKDVNSKKW